MENYKKIFFISLLVILSAGVGFGSGIGLAEIKLRFFEPVQIISLKNTADEKISEPEITAEIVSPEEITEEIKPEEPTPTEESQSPKTTPTTEEKISFAILGDAQYFKPGVYGGFQKAVKKIKEADPDLVFAIGDLISSCNDKKECETKINAWKNTLGTLMKKTYVMQGNHDRTDGEKSDNIWSRLFAMPANGPAGFTEFTYSFDKGNSHFVVLDSDKPDENEINNKQRDWLAQDLARNKKPNVFVFFHEPAYPVSSKIGESLDVNAQQRNELWNILVKHKVKGVFVGHEHITSRRKINGIYQFGFGNTDSFNHALPAPGVAEYAHQGQTYGMVEVSGEKIAVKVFSVDGSLLDNFEY